MDTVSRGKRVAYICPSPYLQNVKYLFNFSNSFDETKKDLFGVCKAQNAKPPYVTECLTESVFSQHQSDAVERVGEGFARMSI